MYNYDECFNCGAVCAAPRVWLLMLFIVSKYLWCLSCVCLRLCVFKCVLHADMWKNPTNYKRRMVKTCLSQGLCVSLCMCVCVCTCIHVTTVPVVFDHGRPWIMDDVHPWGYITRGWLNISFHWIWLIKACPMWHAWPKSIFSTVSTEELLSLCDDGIYRSVWAELTQNTV